MTQESHTNVAAVSSGPDHDGFLTDRKCDGHAATCGHYLVQFHHNAGGRHITEIFMIDALDKNKDQ